MNIHIIPPESWVQFLDQFSRDHSGWVATIKVLDIQAGPQSIAEELPLEGISLDVKGTRPSCIAISVGGPSHGHVNHVVETPLYIREADAADGEIDLQLEPGIGPVTLIHLHSPAT